MKIILDVMGGDNAPLETVKGAALAAQEIKATYILVGDEEQIRKIAEDESLDLSHMDIVDTKTYITMEDDPLSVVRAKQDSSMAIALKLLSEGKGDAVVSTGNTGALFVGATLIVRKIRGFLRAGISTEIPLANPTLLLDSGANVTIAPECLVHFAQMGSAYMNKMFGVENPRVGLLNNGTEPCKGTDLQKEAYVLLSDTPDINFIGNVEANAAILGACDVIVTDGFTGNVFLKTIEGFGKLLLGKLKNAFYSSITTKVAALSLKKPLTNLKKDFDPSERGGSPILGISKPVIKAHGSSDAKAFKNAIKQAIEYAESGVIYDMVEVSKRNETRKKALNENGQDTKTEVEQ